jgi:hypothetical protein
VALFRKAAEPSAPPAQLPALYEPPVQPSAAPRATDLERLIRREIWGVMSPELAHAAGLSLAELIDWVSGATRLSPPQIESLARRMGLIEDTPPTGIDLVRARLRVMMKKWSNFSSHFEWRHGDQALLNFLEGDSLPHDQAEFLARAFWGQDVSIDPVTAELRRPAKVATSAGVPPAPYSGGSNVPGINERTVATLRERLKQLEAAP